eukprot:MONOS_9230.1-p1 / transcript=MONOS_9230.1 / gene=MONOS_9230 / organism=Monocercomonoides_exilis_PA203 / gene_product=unspecified product / transcript_product=unspecified product / location=Mono_scaffold00373:14970-20819(+) / protein_length=1510 / sequence_SO=supercontig / SO=protein_coding / is_pseudo=false
MSCCSFSSVCDVYDGGIVPSLNNPLASLTASNTSFIECCRTRNAEFIGTEENKLTPERQNETENGQNIFIWCEWHESKTTGTNNSVSDGASNGGAIFLCNLPSGSLTVSHCSFIDCSAYYAGGGIMCRLVDSLNIENNSFNACTAQNNGGGCTYANNIASCFRISGCEIQKCSAKNYGGGLCIEYINDLESGCIEAEKGEGGEACLFDCYITSCKLSGTCGGDQYNHFSTGNLLYESFTTNNNDKRLCYAYYSNGLVHQHTEKKEWLNEGMKDRTVGVNGNDSNEMCGASKFIPCLTVGHAVDACTDKLISKITVLGGRHGSEGATISVSEKKIIIVGKGSEVSVIWTRSLSPSSTTLFSVTSGQLDVQHLGIDHNVMRSPSPSVFVMSLGSGSLSLEDVLISSPASAGRNVISASVLIIPFSQLRLSAVVIKNMILTEPIFSEPLSAESVSGDKVLSNITIRNVNRTTGDGVVVEKNVKKGETFVVCNATIEGCESLKGDGGGLFLLVELQGGIKMEMVTFTECKVQQGRSEEEEKRIGGGIFVELSDQIGSFVLEGMIFEGCNAWKGKNMFVSGWDLSEIVNKEHFKWEMSSEELGSLDELCGWERKTTGEKGYVIPLVVYLWSNWSGNGFVSKENGRDFSGCGYSEIPCSSINYLISLRFATLSENKALIMITDPVSLCYSESFLSSSYNTPVVSIEGKEKGTKVIISDDDENDLNDSMISSNVILSFGNISFTIPDRVDTELLGASESTNAIIVNGSSFTNISRIDKGETLLSVDSSSVCSDCEIEDCLMVQCQSTKSEEGGGMKICIKGKDNFVKVSGCVFVMCECSAANGRGGAIMIDACMPTDEMIDIVESLGISHAALHIQKGELSTVLVDEEGEMREECVIEDSRLVPRKLNKVIIHINAGIEARSERSIITGVNEDEGGKADKNENIRNRICKWNGSMVDLKMSRAEMTDTTLKNGINGGLSISGGSAKISAGNFSNNNPAIDGYGSVRRNVICTDLAELNVISLKGGDGILPGSSLWMISEECVLKGIASERVFPFFIPVLESVETREKGEEVEIAFKGKLLLPCNLSFMVVKQMGEEKQIEKHNFKESGYVSETAAKGILPRETITEAGEEVEVSVCILFGNADHPSSTDYLILKNKSEAEPKGDERIFEGEDKIEWSLFAFFGCIVIVVILLFVIVLMVVLLRKKLREPEKKIEKEKLENEQIMENVERRSETNEESFEMIELPSTLLEGMTNQIPLLIDEEENQPEQLETPTMNDEILNENDLPDLEYPMPFSENDSFSGELQLHSFKVISAKKPFREKEKTNIKTLHSTIHSLQGDFTFGTRAMSVIDGKEVVKSVAKLFQHLISVGDERVEIMAKQLCPYTIFASEGNYEIYVLAEELKDKKQKDEMKRWQAPELNSENEEEEEEEEGEGIEKAVVFTLGLILHETTTGEVPLSQCDAEEAQEMMRDGVRPITEGIEEEDLIDLIEEMWEAEPKERPLLSEVINILIEIKENHS